MYAIHAADLDGDGDMDVLSTSQNNYRTAGKIAWYENTDGQGTFTGPQNILEDQGNGQWSVYATDLDGDGDMDVVSGYRNNLKWYENLGGGTFKTDHPAISTTIAVPYSIYAADVDDDGDMDVLATSEDWPRQVAWYENKGINTFTEHVIALSQAGSPLGTLPSVYADDLDGDGDTDVLTASYDDKIRWYENTDGKGTFSTEKVVTSNADGAGSVYAADVDNDGDIDILSASFNDRKIAWYENLGSKTFSEQKIINAEASGANTVLTADFDGDGIIDVFSSSQSDTDYTNDKKLAWYKNTPSYTYTSAQAQKERVKGFKSK